MLAVDQREAMRLMFAGDAAPEPDGSVPARVLESVPDGTLTAFKTAAARTLTPYASGVLADRQFCLDALVREGAVAPGCGLIAAADRFVPGHGEVVTDAVIDEDVDPHAVRAQGAVAMKLLVIWRPDGSPGQRTDMVRRFVRRCRDAGLASIIEPVSRAPRSGAAWDHTAGVLAAARELGDLGADLYKGEVPLGGRGSDAEVRERCAELGAALASPWVVLSSGVPADEFPRAVRLACEAGASGFLAGRAVWRDCIGAPDAGRALRDDAVPRLRRLVDVVDETVAAKAG
ncbi:aldolase [Streptomyces armeniacus]|uniref:Aldolase n=2 Tax=Streptomyces armeniacus TaxID=83291 RepID=A0A345Y099_9ACTN|nr:aldolase [Streptomyces armeniacus]